jgi:hypothetical protein
MKCFRAARIRLGCGSGVQRAFQPGEEGVRSGFVGPGQSRWRHHISADFPDHLLPDFRVGGNVGEIKFVEHHSGGLGSLVVTDDAVLVEQRVLLGNSDRLRGSADEQQERRKRRDPYGSNSTHAPPR